LSNSLNLHDPFRHCRTGSFAVRVDRATRDDGVDVVALSDRLVKAFDKDSSKPFGSIYRKRVNLLLLLLRISAGTKSGNMYLA
jgi:hypothetical protein